jgi:alpha-N-arabinofuranosidase
MVNCLQSLFLADQERFLVTPTFHVFEMYKPHAGGQSVRSVFSAPRIAYQRVNATGSFWGLAGSASLQDRTLTLTVVNPHVSEPREAQIALQGGTFAASGAPAALTLAAADVHAHNTFDRPNAVEPRADRVGAVQNGVLTHRFPPASVTRVTIPLA